VTQKSRLHVGSSYTPDNRIYPCLCLVGIPIGQIHLLVVTQGATLTAKNNLNLYGDGFGGGIFVENNDKLDVAGNLALNSNPAKYGGGIFNVGDFTLYSGNILSNPAKNGGGIYNAYGGTLIYSNSPITGNSATERGDNYYAEAGSTTSGNGITSQFDPIVWGGMLPLQQIRLLMIIFPAGRNLSHHIHRESAVELFWSYPNGLFF